MNGMTQDLILILDHYHEQDCPLSALHARAVLNGEEDPEPFLLEDMDWWTAGRYDR